MSKPLGMPKLNCSRVDDHPAHEWQGERAPGYTPTFWCDPSDPLADRRLSKRPVSAVEVPAELVSRTVSQLNALVRVVHEAHHADLLPLEQCRAGCDDGLRAVAELRALLPQPAPTCPNCGDKDSRHGGDGCEALLCDCRLSRAALPTVRALLDAERDSKPAQAKPRTWKTGDPEPEGVTWLWDRDGDPWLTNPGGGWCVRNLNRSGAADADWTRLLREHGPLTNQPPAGAR